MYFKCFKYSKYFTLPSILKSNLKVSEKDSTEKNFDNFLFDHEILKV